MNEELRNKLIARGMDPNASEEDAQAFMLRIASDPPAAPNPDPAGDPGTETHPPTEDSVRLAQKRATEERQRASDIADLMASWPQYKEQLLISLKEGHSVAQARGIVLEQMERDRPPPKQAVSSGIHYGDDQRSKVRKSLVDSLLLRVGHLKKNVDESESAFAVRKSNARDVCQRNLFDSMRLSLRSCGLSDRGREDDIIQRAFSNSTSDFPAILKDASEKRLLQAYSESPQTWRPLARVTAATDFKAMNRPKFGNMGSLVLTPDLVPMSEGSTVDVNESFQIATYTKRFGVGRQAIINDDLSAFDRIPTMHGQAAARTVSDIVYNLLISASGVGPTMAEDSVALFATTHTSGANYIAAAGAPDVAGLTALKKLMRLQKGLVSAGETAPILNIEARYLLLPATLEVAGLQTLNSLFDPAKSNDITFNPFKNLVPIIEPRLDGGTNGTTAWYLVADPSTCEGLEVAFLNGQDTPTLMEETGNNVLGTNWGVLLDFGVKFIEHRGWARTRGA